MKPMVSVIIPTYMRSNMLSRAIESVLAQTYENIEVVVIDDNDPKTEWRKTTSLVMQKYKNNEKVRYICHPCNKNGSAARNTGIRESEGEIVTFLDDDDYYLPQKIELQVNFLLAHPEYKAVYCGWYRKRKIMPSVYGDMTYELLSGDHIVITNTIMMFKKYALECGGFDERFVRQQEAIFLLRYFAMGEKIGLVKKVLVIFDMSDRSNVASNSDKNEIIVRQLLNCFSEEIEKCERKKKGSKKKIISHRYRGIILGHLKSKNFISAKRVYFEMIKLMPVKFNVDFLSYCFKWIFRLNKES